jgi:hypothetical protein
MQRQQHSSLIHSSPLDRLPHIGHRASCIMDLFEWLGSWGDQSHTFPSTSRVPGKSDDERAVELGHVQCGLESATAYLGQLAIIQASPIHNTKLQANSPSSTAWLFKPQGRGPMYIGHQQQERPRQPRPATLRPHACHSCMFRPLYHVNKPNDNIVIPQASVGRDSRASEAGWPLPTARVLLRRILQQPPS